MTGVQAPFALAHLPTVELAEPGQFHQLRLPQTGRIIKVRVMDTPDGTGPTIDVREFMLDEFWHRIREAQARAAMTGRKIKGPTRAQQFMGPLRKGWWLQAHTAEELSELMAEAVVRTESIQADAS
jgi:NAD(P)H-flavin reductase